MDEMELTNDLTKFPIEAQYLKNGFFLAVKRWHVWFAGFARSGLPQKWVPFRSVGGRPKNTKSAAKFRLSFRLGGNSSII